MKAVIIGAGPAGVTAAYYLARDTDIKPIVIEQDLNIGGISQTKVFNGNRIDLGPHRFFTKSKEVMQLWQDTLGEDFVEVPRTTRIYYKGRYFDYPVTLSLDTVKKLGILKTMLIGVFYILSRILPKKDESNLENFYINRFGLELYKTFFKNYTTKLWGVSPDKISSEWGAQRVKGISITTVILHALRGSDETSLIHKFHYPRYGAGYMYNKIYESSEKLGAEIYLNTKCIGITANDNAVTGVAVKDLKSGRVKEIKADYVFSTMPIKELISNWDGPIPKELKDISNGLVYRDMILVSVFASRNSKNNIPDNWIYIQDDSVKLARIDFVGNFSKEMVKEPNMILMGCEYFCYKEDNFWNKDDIEIGNFAISELKKLGFLHAEDTPYTKVFRVPNAYPAYTGSYKDFDKIKNFTDKFDNLFLIGRNGMHKYNNMDHSMLTAKTAVENIIHGIKAKDNIWNVNTEKEYHEVKK